MDVSLSVLRFLALALAGGTFEGSSSVWAQASVPMATPSMYYTDTDRGQRFAKDPDVVRFRGQLWLYYSILRPGEGFAIGIAAGTDLDHWKKVGEILPSTPEEEKGLCAPAAIVLGGKIHLFYQTYGNGPRDAICLATSEDGIHFLRNPENPIFRPTGDWNCGRAIDADVVVDGEQLLMFVATRDPGYTTQMVTGASAPLNSGFGRQAWRPLGNGPLLRPELAWEKKCIEAPAVLIRDGRLYMFYAGGYNNEPQQIGCAVSRDGIDWRRLSLRPLLPNGGPGEWNTSESGHPGIFADDDGRTHLFFQGNHDGGKSWSLSRMEVLWAEGLPWLRRPHDGVAFRLQEPTGVRLPAPGETNHGRRWTHPQAPWPREPASLRRRTPDRPASDLRPGWFRLTASSPWSSLDL